MDNPRILFAYQFLGVGGVEVVLKTRLESLASLGIAAHALFLSGGAGASLFSAVRERTTVTDDEAEWLRLLQEFRPDWLLSIDTPAILPIARRHAPGARLAYEVHTPYPEGQAHLIDGDELAGVSGLFVPSPSQRDLVRSITSDRWPVKVVPNALPKSFAGSAEGAFTAPASPVIGWVGRLDSLKNWRGFLRIAEGLRDADVQFWLVGGEESSAAQREALERSIQELRLSSRVSWFPRVAHGDMPSFYRSVAQSGGCLLSTSWAESFGMTLLEAAACDCPVVVPDVVGLRDLVIDGRNGLLYPAGDHPAAVSAVRSLLGSAPLRRTVTRGAARQLQRFTPEISTKVLLRTLTELRKPGSRTSRKSPAPQAHSTTRHLISAASSSALEIEHRDRLIRGLQGELAEKVGQRDQAIVSLRGELLQKTEDRDQTIRALQGELLQKTAERDRTIADLQSELEAKVRERDSIIAGLQQELHQKVGAANEVISALQAELNSATVGREAEARHRDEIFARDEQTLALRTELQASIAALQGELRESEAVAREQQFLFEMRLREAQIDHERALLESEKQLAVSMARRDAEATLLQEEVGRLRGEIARSVPPEEMQRAREEIQRLEFEAEQSRADRASIEEALQSSRAEIAAVGEALAAEQASRASAEQLQALLREQHDALHAELGTMREQMDTARRALQDQETLTDEIRESLRAEAGSVRLRLSNTQFELGMTRQELLAIYRSKLWRLGSTYWRWLQALGRIPRVAGTSTDDGWQHLPVACPSCGDTIKLLDLMMAAPASAAALPEPEHVVVTEVEANVVPIFPDAPVAPLAREDRFDVVCFPIIDWDFRFQRPQQLMSQYARAGHRVFYISQRFRPAGRPFEIRRVRDSIYEVSLKAPKRNIYSSTMSRKDIDEFFASLNALRKEAGIHAAAAMVQLPFWWPLADRARRQFGWSVVYDCMDHHHGFSGTTREAVHEEKKLMRGADLVVVSSTYLERQARKHTEKVLLVRNGCDFEHFAGRAAKPRMARPVIGYYGAIADWFDSDLVADLAARRPDWDFVLVGSSHLADISRLQNLPNVQFTGEKSYSEIPEWLASFDVAIIPFKRTPLTEATNPVKCYEMLAGGKPVVAVPIPEVAQLAPFVRLASTVAEFEREIAQALAENGDEAIEERQRFARANTWEERFAALDPAIKECFPLASVVIVTYNNLELNRACLRSLYERTEWPRFEVFVVDNASTDGTPQFLLEAQQIYPNLKVTLNSTNAGFPAANNQALREARGEYIVLLNNDTVSTRGFMSALFRHLHRDRKIGLVGPSTNAIGNEGMVDVGYKDVQDLAVWAAQFIRQHDGEVFDIPMLAMFCVAMRRDTFEKLGLLDENFGMGMFEDDDYSHRVRELKLRVACARDSFVHHWMRAAFSKVPQPEYDALFARNRRYYESKWGREWQPHQRSRN